MRSILIVPAASRAAFEAALASEADALAIDLTDGDEDGLRSGVDMIVAAQAAGKRRLAMIHPLGAGLADSELDAIMAAAPEGIVLPEAIGGRDIQHLGVKLAVREAENNLPAGFAKILALAADSPGAVFELGSVARAAPRLIGVGRDEARLAGSLGLARKIDGEIPGPLRIARSLCLLAAAAAGAPAFDCAEPGDGEAFLHACALAARDGFAGKFATTPAQAKTINAAFVRRPDQKPGSD